MPETKGTDTIRGRVRQELRTRKDLQAALRARGAWPWGLLSGSTKAHLENLEVRARELDEATPSMSHLLREHESSPAIAVWPVGSAALAVILLHQSGTSDATVSAVACLLASDLVLRGDQ